MLTIQRKKGTEKSCKIEKKRRKQKVKSKHSNNYIKYNLFNQLIKKKNRQCEHIFKLVSQPL